MKYLDGRDLADFVKERQARQVRALRQAEKIFPKLAIVSNQPDLPTQRYLELKRAYGADILIEVELHECADDTMIRQKIGELNDDPSVHGIIVQLPLKHSQHTDEIVNLVAPGKDVDGLGQGAVLDPATPTAINWLLAGYNVDLKNKQIAVVGQGRLVGAPLTRMWQASDLEVTSYDESNQTSMRTELKNYDIIVTATGVPSLIGTDQLKLGAVVVDAGTASVDGRLVGDVDPAVRDTRDDLTITPRIGGVGPLTVAALFENLIRAARP